MKVRTALSNGEITYYFVYSKAETSGNLNRPSFTITLELTVPRIIVQFPRKAPWNLVCLRTSCCDVCFALLHCVKQKEIYYLNSTFFSTPDLGVSLKPFHLLEKLRNERGF